MKRNIYIIILCFLFALGCKKQALEQFSSQDNIYLRYLDKDGNQDTTTISYSFAYSPGLAQDTIWVPVIISGKRVANDRQFVLSVVDSSTTAVKDLHYQALKSSYTLPADSGKISIPIILKNTDAALAEKSVTLAFRITSGGDFKADLPVALRSKKVIFSSRLEKPTWWIYWQSSLGEYGRIKHQLFLISSGTIDLVDQSKPDAFLQIPRSLYYIDNTKNFLRDPFTWVARNPASGYVLTRRADVPADYDFYNSATPTKRFYLKYFPQVNGYFFLDESGKQIVI